jgi:hypothetical protein
MHGTFNGELNDDGSITWQRGGIRYKYPTAGLDYDYVEIEYIGKDKDDKETGSLSSNILKDYNTTADYMPEGGGNQYPTLSLPSGKIKFLVRNAPSGGMAIQLNVPSATTEEQLPTYKRTMKFTKATFTKGNRYTITFDPNYTDAPAIPVGFGVKGISIGTGKLPYLESRGNQDFVGWFLASDDTEIKETTVPTDAQLTDNKLALKAKWDTLITGKTFTVDFKDAGIGLTPVGNGTTAVLLEDGDDTGYTFTYGSGGYPSSWAKFNITLDEGVRLSSYKEVTIQYQSAGGDTDYKPFALLAAAQLPANFSSDPHLDGGQYRINSSNPQGSTTDTWKDLKFTIDPAKAAGLQGTIQVCIYDHSAADKDGTKTAWKIKNVIFVADTP